MNTPGIAGQIRRLNRKATAAYVRGERHTDTDYKHSEDYLGDYFRRLTAKQLRRYKTHSRTQERWESKARALDTRVWEQGIEDVVYPFHSETPASAN